MTSRMNLLAAALLTVWVGSATAGEKSKLPVSDVSLEDGQTISVPAGAELLQMTVAVPETVQSGQRYRYRVQLSNVSENVTLTNVRLMQLAGANVEIQEESKKSKTAESGSNRSWSFGKLAPGQATELAVTAIAGESGETDHCFAVKYQETLCTSVKVTDPTVKITKSAPEQVGVCELFELRYELTNTGTGTAKNFVVRDQLPEGLVTRSGKKQLEFRVPELAQGKSEVYAATVHAMKAGDYASRAVVEQKDGDTHESKQPTTTVIAPELNAMIAGPRAFKAGEEATFDVTVKNTSDVVAQNVELTLTPDGDVEFTEVADGDARQGGKSYMYTLGDLEPGAQETVTVTVDSTTAGKVAMNAKAESICELNEEMVVAKANASLTTRVLKITGLLLSVIDTEDVIASGNNITYRIRVKNQGEFKDENVQVALTLPEGLKFVEAEGASDAKSEGQTVTLETVDVIEPGKNLEWFITCKTQSAGEKLVKGTLNSKGLQNEVKAEEASTIFDGGNAKSSQ